MQKLKVSREGQKLTNAEAYLLNGPVKEVMQITYNAHLKNGQVVQGKIANGILHNGNCIYLFSPAGATLLEKDVDSNEHYSIKTYNERGNVLESYTHYSDTHISRFVYSYNETGQMTGSVFYGTDGQVASRTVHTFDEDGVRAADYTYKRESEQWDKKTVFTNIGPLKLVNGIPYRLNKSIVYYLADGSVESKSTWEYNADWKETEQVSWHVNPKMEHSNRRTVHTYNSQGDLIQFDIYKGDGSLDKSYTYQPEYDANGKKIEQKRDENDNIIDYNPLEEGETEQLEYDHHQNWVKRTVFGKDLPKFITIRQFTYYGEPSENNPPFNHPLSVTLPEDVSDKSSQLEGLTEAQAQWVMDGAAKADAFPLHRYYAMRFQDVPSSSDFNYENIETDALLKLLTTKMTVNMVHSTTSRGHYDRIESYVLSFPFHPGYLLSVSGIARYDADNYEVPGRLRDYVDEYDHLYFGNVELLHPSKDTANYDEMLEDDLEYFIGICAIDRLPEKPFIYIVEVNGSGFVLKSHPVNDHFEIRDLDINYGQGFTAFHNDLIQRFNSSTKGLVLFHGEPGTGKTYYIRHLLRKMVANRKKVIYMPPNMVDHLIDPAFMSFLAKEIRHWSSQGLYCVLLIEDAEPLLARRREGIRIQGVTNLLNLSDGLLNDMLNLQIICTFNVDLKKLDSALLRPGRLIARKEFKRLDELDANLLAQRLGIRHHFTEPATLSEVYGMMQNQNTLIHEVSAADKDAGSEKDDL